jgi:hypothetical protein
MVITSYAAYLDAYLLMLQRPWNGTYPGFTRLYISADLPTVVANAASSRLALCHLHSTGMKIELLVDGSAWVKSAAGVSTGLSICRQVRWFNGNATNPADTLDVVHRDIEPHAIPGNGWTQNAGGGTDAYKDIRVWQANLIAVFRRCQAILEGSGMVLAWDVPDFYYNEVGDLWTPLAQDAYVDYVSVTTYHSTLQAMRNGLNGVGGVYNVLAALQGSVPAIFGIELADTRLAAPDISFYQEGTIVAEAVLANLSTSYAPYQSFWGVAVHDRYAYSGLAAGGFPGVTTLITT